MGSSADNASRSVRVEYRSLLVLLLSLVMIVVINAPAKRETRETMISPLVVSGRVVIFLSDRVRAPCFSSVYPAACQPTAQVCHLPSTSKVALKLTCPLETDILRSHVLKPDFFMEIWCWPEATPTLDGVLPTKLPSISMSAPAGSEATDSCAEAAGAELAAAGDAGVATAETNVGDGVVALAGTAAATAADVPTAGTTAAAATAGG